jgi:hypothetical protein
MRIRWTTAPGTSRLFDFGHGVGDQLLPRVVTDADEITSPSRMHAEMDSVKREIDEILSEAAAQVREF